MFKAEDWLQLEGPPPLPPFAPGQERRENAAETRFADSQARRKAIRRIEVRAAAQTNDQENPAQEEVQNVDETRSPLRNTLTPGRKPNRGGRPGSATKRGRGGRPQRPVRPVVSNEDETSSDGNKDDEDVEDEGDQVVQEPPRKKKRLTEAERLIADAAAVAR